MDLVRKIVGAMSYDISNGEDLRRVPVKVILKFSEECR